ncbi:biotin--[acetyl-CoA-carboxylase] ligase [Falsirhodobacter halotolerans]|uniref:biotin--[acetyl-CoA-carboxylase] ligase n=1 Tax=Falsirhodobacter halotolerans TaxID=1146892 RepID=UPI001FD02B63|nr:biotin--[acetyl-CoA-carboxylase] ligase [Falsirhodobacter halotolerans]MCJ8140186.1 biotin--[acetyl-CoA-carboxylase] ligase [Falsirhodobacter halotolerans]
MSADWPEGVARHVLDRVDSTNAEGFRLTAHPAWVLAVEQTAGRGRRGRIWSSPRGNFYGSHVSRPTGPADRAALRSFVAALSLRDALVAVTGLETAFTLKWPNDVLLNGGKLSGILLEGQGGLLAVGMGVNLIASPPAEAVEATTVRPTNLLAETGFRLTPEQLLARLAPAFAAREAQLAQGFDGIRHDFLAHAARVGERITARTMTASHTGIYRTVDDHGALVLDTEAGRITIPAADIFFADP